MGSLLRKAKSVASSVVKDQKARLSNVANTLSTAFTGRTLSGEKATVKANTNSQTLNKVLETAANHPLATAAVATVALKAAPLVAAGAKSLASKVPVGGALAKIGGSSLLAAGAGYVAGSLLSSGKSSQSSAPTLNQTPSQDNRQDNRQYSYQIDKSVRSSKISGSPGAQIDQGGPFQEPIQAPEFTPSQSLRADQPTTQSSSSTNWGLILAAAAIVYALGR